MKIYTETGDRGKTSLFSGERVSKGHVRVEAYGEVDELNSTLGAVTAALDGKSPGLDHELRRIQSNLFHIGAWLATSVESPSMVVLKKISEQESKSLESAIDCMQAEVPELHNFILPGGHMSAAWAHVARTVCRRTERHVVVLYEQQEDEASKAQFQAIVLYLNRLSDYLFMLARYCNHLFGKDDILWSHEEPS